MCWASDPWDFVVMHGFSTLDPKKPGDPTILIASVRQMAEFLHAKNSAAEIRVMATWPRADQTYEPKGAWYGKPIEAMARDVRDGYNRAAEAPGIKGVVPVGDAWVRAMHTGIADANPYDGIDAGKVNLWTYDGYHASTYGYYLQALVIFGSVTGKDPRILGSTECSGFELGLSAAQVGALQQVAFDQLAAEGAMNAAAAKPLEQSVRVAVEVRRRALMRQFILDHPAALHHEFHVLQEGDVRGGIALHRDQIGEFPGLHRADIIGPIEQPGG